MNKKVWGSDKIVENGVDEDCITSRMTFNNDGSITAEVEHHIYLNGETYSGHATIKVKK